MERLSTPARNLRKTKPLRGFGIDNLGIFSYGLFVPCGLQRRCLGAAAGNAPGRYQRACTVFEGFLSLTRKFVRV